MKQLNMVETIDAVLKEIEEDQFKSLKESIDYAKESVFGDFKELIKDLLSRQPYIVQCKNCGEHLEFNTEEYDLDIVVEVKPCKCVKQK